MTMKNTLLLILSMFILASCSKDYDNTLTYYGNNVNNVQIKFKTNNGISILRNFEVKYSPAIINNKLIDTTFTFPNDKKGTKYDVTVYFSNQFPAQLKINDNNTIKIDT